MTEPLTVTDLFAGAGGSSTGLALADWRIEVAANHNPTAVATHRLNHPDTDHRIADLSEVDWMRFPTTTLLWGSPSCTAQAKAGGRQKLTVEDELRRDDPRAIDRATAFAIVAAAEVHLYPVVIVENVPEFRDWVLYRWWLEGMRALGYRIEQLVLDARDFGHAQNRKRLFIVATRDGLDVDLTPPTIAPVYADQIVEDDPGKPVTRRLYVADQLDAITEENVPHLVTYRKHSKARRADAHQLATITAGANHHAVARVIDGQQWHRMLSNRECARGQGFPDSYEFTGNQADVKRQIGNAVPVGVARWFGVRVAAALRGEFALTA
jgi:DNA (cytosine-5)-methyltransferase 1